MSGLGPCVICGATGYSPSLGGPGICPQCDCGHFDGAALAHHNAKLTARLTQAEEDRDDYRERLHDLVMVDSEEWATGGGPGFKDRKDKAWTRAREPFEP